MSVNQKYYYNLSGNISDGKKEYSLHHKEDKIGGLSISSGLKENHIEYGTNSLLDLLNELYKEKEDWKHNCLTSVSENSILWNEISILREQGAEPSDAFKNYLNGLKSKNKKLQGDDGNDRE